MVVEVFLEALNSVLGLFLVASILFFLRLFRGSVFRGALGVFLAGAALLAARELVFLLTLQTGAELTGSLMTAATLVLFVLATYRLKALWVRLLGETGDRRLVASLQALRLEKNREVRD